MSKEKMIVSVEYYNAKSLTWSKRQYSYYTDVVLKPGDLLKAPTNHGEALARVAQVDIPKNEIPQMLRMYLKTITPECLVDVVPPECEQKSFL